MDNTDLAWQEPSLENLLDSSRISIEDKSYTVYFPTEIAHSDVPFAYSQNGGDLLLFQITSTTDNKNYSKNKLQELDFNDLKTLESLIEITEKIRSSYNKESLTSLNANWEGYNVSFQPDDMSILGETFHQQYYKKILNRN
jgi:hypothetical protein